MTQLNTFLERLHKLSRVKLVLAIGLIIASTGFILAATELVTVIKA